MARKKTDTAEDTSFPHGANEHQNETPPEAIPVEEGQVVGHIANPTGRVRDDLTTHALEKAREQLGHKPREDATKVNDPHYFEVISLTDKNDGAKLHLGRSNRHKDMLIKFDVRPEGEIAEVVFALLKENGFHWNRDAKAWTMKIDNEHKWRSHQNAEKLFNVIGNMFREANGLQPVSEVGHSHG